MKRALTSKQEAFAQGVADGLTLADAYRGAYDAARMKPTTLWVKAAELMADGNVSVRVTELRAQLAERAMWTREQSVAVLAEVARGGEKDADRVRAVAELNAMHGYGAPKKMELTGRNGGPVQVASPHQLTDDELAAIASGSGG